MARAEATIANYDAQTADEIRQRLRTLSQSDLAKLEAYEKQGQARSTILERIADLRGDAPWSGYDDMEVEEINAALKQRDGDALRRVLDYERRHKDRTTIIDFATRMQEASEGSSASRPTQAQRAGGTNGSQASTRSQPSQSSRSKRSTGKDTTAASREAATGKSATPSRPARPRKTAASTTRAKTTSSRTSTRRSPGSQQGKRSGGSSRPRSQSSRASRPATQVPRTSTAPSSQSELDASDFVQAASASIAQRVTEALQGAEERTKKLAKEAEHAVGSATQNSAVGAAVKDTGEAVAEAARSGARSAKRKRDSSNGSATQDGGSGAARGDAAQNAPDLAATAKLAVSNVTELAVRFKGPAIAIAAATGSALALKRRKRRKRRTTMLGITLPRSSELEIQSVTKTLGRASKQFGKTSKVLCKDIQRVGDQAERIGKILD